MISDVFGLCVRQYQTTHEAPDVDLYRTHVVNESDSDNNPGYYPPTKRRKVLISENNNSASFPPEDSSFTTGSKSKYHDNVDGKDQNDSAGSDHRHSILDRLRSRFFALEDSILLHHRDVKMVAQALVTDLWRVYEDSHDKPPSPPWALLHITTELQPLLTQSFGACKLFEVRGLQKQILRNVFCDSLSVCVNETKSLCANETSGTIIDVGSDGDGGRTRGRLPFTPSIDFHSPWHRLYHLIFIETMTNRGRKGNQGDNGGNQTEDDFSAVLDRCVGSMLGRTRRKNDGKKTSDDSSADTSSAFSASEHSSTISSNSSCSLDPDDYFDTLYLHVSGRHLYATLKLSRDNREKIFVARQEIISSSIGEGDQYPEIISLTLLENSMLGKFISRLQNLLDSNRASVRQAVAEKGCKRQFWEQRKDVDRKVGHWLTDFERFLSKGIREGDYVGDGGCGGGKGDSPGGGGGAMDFDDDGENGTDVLYTPRRADSKKGHKTRPIDKKKSSTVRKGGIEKSSRKPNLVEKSAIKEKLEPKTPFGQLLDMIDELEPLEHIEGKDCNISGKHIDGKNNSNVVRNNGSVSGNTGSIDGNMVDTTLDTTVDTNSNISIYNFVSMSDLLQAIRVNVGGGTTNNLRPLLLCVDAAGGLLSGIPWEALPSLSNRRISRSLGSNMIDYALSQHIDHKLSSKHRNKPDDGASIIKPAIGNSNYETRTTETETKETTETTKQTATRNTSTTTSATRNSSGYYLLNPTSDPALVRSMESMVLPVVRDELQWTGLVGGTPASSDDLLKELLRCDAFLFAGHYGGEKMIDCEQLELGGGAIGGQIRIREENGGGGEKTATNVGKNNGIKANNRKESMIDGNNDKKAVSDGKQFSLATALLMGCASAKDYVPKSNSSGFARFSGKISETFSSEKPFPSETFSTPCHYLIGGAPCVVGTLWDVLSGEIDRGTVSILRDSDIGRGIGFGDKIGDKKLNTVYGDKIGDKKQELSTISITRSKCRLPHLTGASLVQFGLPLV